MKYEKDYKEMLKMMAHLPVTKARLEADGEGRSDDEMYLYGPILDEQTRLLYESWLGDDAGIMSANKMAKLLAKMDGDITLRINSPGGIVSEGSAIASLIADYSRGTISAVIDGACYSAAVNVMLAAENRRISKLGEIMVHRPYTMAMGDADEMKDAAKNLEELENTMFDFVQERTGMERGKITEMVMRGTFLQPKDAIALGFVQAEQEDEKMEADEGEQDEPMMKSLKERLAGSSNFLDRTRARAIGGDNDCKAVVADNLEEAEIEPTPEEVDDLAEAEARLAAINAKTAATKIRRQCDERA